MTPRNFPWLEWWKAFAEEAEFGTIDLGRYEAEFFAWGNGPPIVCVHGLADSFLAFFPLAALLKSHFRVIAYNLPDGFRDKARLNQYTLAGLTQDLLRVLHHFGLRQTTLVGHSYGSAVILSAAHCSPQRIARAVTICGFAHRPLRPWQIKLLQLGRLMPPRWSCLTPYHADLRRALCSDPSVAFPTAGLSKGRYVRLAAEPHPLRRWPRVCFRAWVHWALQLSKTDLRPVLSEIDRPTLIVATERDPLVPETCQQELLAKLPHAIGFRVQAWGHFPNWTHPYPVAHAISEFCRMTSLPNSFQTSCAGVARFAPISTSAKATCPLWQAVSQRVETSSSVRDTLAVNP